MSRRLSAALYGFVAWVAIHICFSIFLMWAYTPDRYLISLGVTYFPDKHWALALPCWSLVSLLSFTCLYATYNAMRRPDLESLSNIVDEYTRVPDERDLGGARQKPRPEKQRSHSYAMSLSPLLLPGAQRVRLTPPCIPALAVWADDEQLPSSVDLPITTVSRLIHLPPAASGSGHACGGSYSGSSSSPKGARAPFGASAVSSRAASRTARDPYGGD